MIAFQPLRKFKEISLLTFIIFLGLVLRILIHLNGPLSFDEICSWSFARRRPFFHMLKVALSDPTPPLYYTVLHFTMRLLGDSPAIMRIPSVVFGIIILPLVYWCMRLGSFEKRDSLQAVLLVSCSSFLIYYSQEVRAYSMLAALGILSTVLFFKCFKNPNSINKLFYVLTIFVLSNTHYYGLLLIAAQGISIIIYRQWKRLGLPLLASVLTFLFLFLRIWGGSYVYSDAIDRATSWGAVIALINMLNVGTLNLMKITGLQPAPPVAYPQFTLNLVLSVTGLVIFSIIFFYGLIKLKVFSHSQRQFLAILSLCIFLPIIMALLAGGPFFSKPQWLLRGLIYIWPLYYMLAIALLSPLRMKIYFVVLIVILNGFSLYPYYTGFTRCKQASALRELNYRTTSRDLVVANPQYFYEVINYYYHGDAQRAGYERTRGWVDLKKMERSYWPFRDAESVPLTSPPSVEGDVYFFWWIDDTECLKPFLKNRIFVYDGERNTWKRYDLINKK